MNARIALYILINCINLFFICIKWRIQQLPAAFKIYSAVPASAIIVEICTEYIFADLPNNLFIYHLFNPIEYAIYAYFFHSILISPFLKKSILLSIPSFVLLSAIISASFQPITENNSFTILLESCAIIAFCLFYFRQILLYEVDKKAEKNPLFWTTTAILVYFLQAFFIEALLKYLIQVSNSKAIWYYRLCYSVKTCTSFIIFTALIVDSLNRKNTIPRVRS